MEEEKKNKPNKKSLHLLLSEQKQSLAEVTRQKDFDCGTPLSAEGQVQQCQWNQWIRWSWKDGVRAEVEG